MRASAPTAQRTNSGSAAWLGDLLNLGHVTYPQLAEQFDEEGDTCDEKHHKYRQYKYVMGAVSPELRKKLRRVDATGLGYGHWKEVASLPEREQEKWLKQASKGEWTTKRLREEIKKERAQKALESTPPVKGEYDVIVIDPPWPMEKIERDVAPRDIQVGGLCAKKNGLAVTSPFSDDDCKAIAALVDRFNESINWIAGDWFYHVSRQYGEDVAHQWFDEFFPSMSPQMKKECVWVSEQFPPVVITTGEFKHRCVDLRSTQVPGSHHRAPLNNEKQPIPRRIDVPWTFYPAAGGQRVARIVKEAADSAGLQESG